MDWEKSTIYRFEALATISEMDYDSILYLDADTNLKQKAVSYKELFPADLFGIRHPWMGVVEGYNPFEEREQSSAFIKNENRVTYYQASIYGGKGEMVKELILDAKERLLADIHNGIMAVYQDESYVQPFLNLHNATVTNLIDIFTIGDKGLGEKRNFLWGKGIDLTKEWSDELYDKMIRKAISFIDYSLDWDIENKKVVRV
jgi:hypothetical protein